MDKMDYYMVMKTEKTPAYDNDSVDYWAYRDYGKAMGKFREELKKCQEAFDMASGEMVLDSSNCQEWRDDFGNGYAIYCAGEKFCD